MNEEQKIDDKFLSEYDINRDFLLKEMSLSKYGRLFIDNKGPLCESGYVVYSDLGNSDDIGSRRYLTFLLIKGFSEESQKNDIMIFSSNNGKDYRINDYGYYKALGKLKELYVSRGNNRLNRFISFREKHILMEEINVKEKNKEKFKL